MKNTFLITFLVIILLLFAGVFYINKVFIPIHFKEIVINKAEEYLDRDIKLENLHFSLLSGLAIDDLDIYQKDDNTTPLVHLDKATIGINFLSIFLQQQIIIPSVEIVNPTIYVKRDKNGLWNFQDLLPQTSATKDNNDDAKPIPNVIIERFVLENGNIEFQDDAITPNLNEKITINSLRASLTLRRGVDFYTEISLPNINGQLKAEGDFNPFTKKGNVQLSGRDLLLTRYWAYANQNEMTLESGTLNTFTLNVNVDDKRIDANGNISLSKINFKDPNNKVAGDIDINDLVVKWNNGLSDLKGQIQWNNAEANFMKKYSIDGDIHTSIQSAGYNDQYQFFKGSVSLKDIIATGEDIGSFSGSVSSKNISINKKSDGISILGDVNIAKPDLSGSFGNLKAETVLISKLDVQQDSNEVLVNVNVEMSGANVNTRNQQKITGDIAWNNGRLIFDKQNNIQTEGTILFRQGNIIIDDQTNINGNISLNQLKATIKPNDNITTTASSVHLSESTVKYAGHTIKGTLNINDLDASMLNKNIAASGNVTFNKADITLASSEKIQGNISLQNLQTTIEDKKITVNTNAHLDQLSAILNENRYFQGSIKANNTSIVFENPQLSLKSNVEFQNVKTSYNQYSFQGSPIVDIIFDGNITKLLDGKYDANIKLMQASVAGLPQVDIIKDINTSLTVKNDALSITDLKLTALGVPINLKGTVTNFQNMTADIVVSTDMIDLVTIEPFLTKQLEAQQIDLISGRTKVNGSFKGLISDPLKGMIDATIVMDNIGLISGKLQKTVSALSGTIRTKNNELIFDTVEGLVDNRKLIMSGSINNFSQPAINASLNVDGLIDASINAIKRDDKLQISSLQLRAYDSQVTGNGSILLTQGQAPFINLALQSMIETRDITQLAPWLKEKIDPLNIKGSIRTTATIKGYTDNWKLWESSVNISTPFFSAKGYKATNIDIRATQSKGKISSMKATATIYDGLVETLTSVDLQEDSLPFDTSIKISRLDLSKFIKDFPSLRTNNVAGWFNTQASLQGSATDILNINGNGSMEITEGYLKEIKIFKGAFSALNTVTNLNQDILITEASSNFKIENQKVYFEKAILRGDPFGFSASGSIGFDQTLNMTLTPDATASISLGKSGGNIPVNIPLGDILIEGPISNPKVTPQLSAGKLLENTIKNTVGGLLEGLLNQ